MPFTHTVIRSYRDASGSVIQATENVTTDTEHNLDLAVVHNASDVHVTYALTRANLKSLAIQSDIAVTICTNAASGGSPHDTITLAAGQQIIWSLASDTLAKCPFTAGADVSALYISGSGSGADGTLKVRALVHEAP